MDVDDQCSPLIWSHYERELGLEELKHSLLSTTWELEMSVLSAKDEISRRECDLIQLRKLLSRAIKERDEAQLRCQSLQQEKLLLLKMHQNTTTASSGSSESESNTSAISNVVPPAVMPEAVLELIAEKPLPEKGRLLQAVMDAGPLLETLLLAGPLPQWQHPPPQLNYFDIPLVSISINNLPRKLLD
ncbi:unnamed protein product [Rhodiola kirilowii]